MTGFQIWVSNREIGETVESNKKEDKINLLQQIISLLQFLFLSK